MEILNLSHNIGLVFLIWLSLLVAIPGTTVDYTTCPYNLQGQSGELTLDMKNSTEVKGQSIKCSFNFLFPSEGVSYIFYLELVMPAHDTQRTDIKLPDGSFAKFMTNIDNPRREYYFGSFILVNNKPDPDLVKLVQNGKFKTISVDEAKVPLAIITTSHWKVFAPDFGMTFYSFKYFFVPIALPGKKGSVTAEFTETPTNNPEKQTSSSSKVPFIIVLSLLGVCGGIIAFLAYKIRKTSPSYSPTAQN